MRYEMRVFLSQSSRRIGEMIAFLRALRNIVDVLGSALFFIYFCEFWLFYTQRFFYILYVFKETKLAKFIRFEAGWKLMWWCGDVVMRWKPRIKNMRHWVLCKNYSSNRQCHFNRHNFLFPNPKGWKIVYS